MCIEKDKSTDDQKSPRFLKERDLSKTFLPPPPPRQPTYFSLTLLVFLPLCLVAGKLSLYFI
jgi:hypothetical protein